MKLFTSKRVKILLITFAILTSLFAIVGFFVLPGYIKPKLIDTVSNYTGRQVHVRELRINPFALSLTLTDFGLADKQSNKFLGAHELYVNIELKSFFTGTYTFSEISIDSPYVLFKIFPDSTTTFTNLTPAEPAQPEQKESTPLVIEKFSIRRGSTVFEDQTRPTPFSARFDSLSFSLTDFTTRPQENGLYSFDAQTEQGEHLSWKGTVTTVPPRSSGSFNLSGVKARRIWEFMQHRFLFEITDGVLAIKGNYDFSFENEKPEFRINKSEAIASALTIIEKDTRDSIASVPNVGLSGFEFDFQKQSVRIGSIIADSALLFTRRDSENNFSIKTVLKPIPDKSQQESSVWDFRLDKTELRNSTCFVFDQNTTPATTILLSPLQLTMENFHMDSNEPSKLTIATGINKAGTIRVKGTMIPLPISSDFELNFSNVGLQPFQLFVDKFAHLTIESGSLSLDGNFTYKEKGSDADKTFRGSVAVDSFRATDQKLQEDFLRWSRLELNSIDFQSNTNSFTIDEIILTRPYLRAIIDSSRKTNFHYIMAMGSDSAMHDTSKPKNQMKTKIGGITIADGSMNFTDLSLTPNFATGIHELNGTITELSSEQLTHATVDIKGKVDQYAPVNIKGEINPLSEDVYTDIIMQFQNIELTTFTPYSGKFAGYKIDKGKLSLDLRYKLNKNYLQGENRVVVDQLTLGEEVEGPDVTGMPVKLAIALLKDRHGVIDLDLPVEGNLNDPEFSIFPIIIKVLVNTVTKAVMAPFAFIGSLFGGGEDLSYVQFQPGSDSLEAEQVSKLSTVAKALSERPELRLDIRGLYSDSLDKKAMVIRALQRQLRTNKDVTGKERLSETEQLRVLELYRTTFGISADSLIPKKDAVGNELQPQERQQKLAESALHRLLASVQISNEELRALAIKRSTEIKNRLVAFGNVTESNIFLLDAQSDAEIVDGKIQITLALDAK
ncbi:MAG: DUF748 domain-containing protein [Ignavibacteriae bacterium]|nr:DUF748 domain-containing protein [Ignavibacteriota bacterium]